MAYKNRISILITAEDTATPVLAATAAKAEEQQTAMAASAERSAAKQTASMDEASAATKAYGDTVEQTAAKTTAASEEMSAASSKAARGRGFGTVGKVATGVALATAVAAGLMVKSAGTYQQSITRLATSAGESVKNLTLVSNGVLKVARDTGTSTKQLTSAMYTIESGGQHGAAGLAVLKAAAQGAKTENADLATVADAVTSAMTDYHIKADQAATVTSKLVAATGQGKTTFQQLAAAMPAILPTASAAHISLNEILGDLASMTRHGMSADQSAQNLAHSIKNLQSPTTVMSKEMASLGLNSTKLSQNLGKTGLYGTIQEISKAITDRMGKGASAVILNMTDALKGLPPAVQKMGQELINGSMSYETFYKAAKQLNPLQRSQVQAFMSLYDGMHTIGTEQMTGAQVMQTYAGAMHKALGTSDALNVALMLTGQNSQYTHQAIKAVSNASAEAGNNVKGWSEIQGNFNQQMSVLKEDVGTTGIAIGTALLPALTHMAKDVDGVLGPIANFVNDNRNLTSGIMLTVGGLATFIGITFATKKAVGAIKDTFNTLGDVKDAAGGAIKAARKMGGSIITTAAKWAKSLGRMAADSASAAGSFAKDGSKAAASWMGSLAKMLKQSSKTAASIAVDALKSAGAWIKAAHESDIGFGGTLLKMIGNSIRATAIFVRDAAVTSAAWVVSAAKTATVWLVKTLPEMALNFGKTGIAASRSALTASAAWVVSAAKSSAAWVASKAVVVASWIAQTAVAVAQGAIQGAIWVANAAKVGVYTAAIDVAKTSTYTLSTAVGTTAGAMGGLVALAAGDIALLVADVKRVSSLIGQATKLHSHTQSQIQQVQSDISNLNKLRSEGKVSSQQYAASMKTFQHSLSTLQGNSSWFKSFGFALGTNYAPGGLSLVGEQGPELVNLPQGSQVFTNAETRSMLGSSGHKVVIQNLNINNNVDAGLVVRQIGWKLKTA